MSKKIITSIILLLIIIVGLCIFLADNPESGENLNKTEVRICVDNPITVDIFVESIKSTDYYAGYDPSTLSWLESLNENYMVFSSQDSYYIMSPADAKNLDIEIATDVSIYNVCNCTVDEVREFGADLNDICLISDVDFLYKDYISYPV